MRKALVERLQFPHQHAQGPAVGDDVVHRQQQDMLLVVQTAAGSPGTADPRSRSNGRRASSAISRRASRFALVAAQPLRSTTGSAHGASSRDHLDRLAVAEARRWSAAPRGGARSPAGSAPERRTSRGPRQPQGARNVVDGTSRLELVEEPEPLLGERERAAALPARPARQRRSDAARLLASRTSRSAPPVPRRRRLEQSAQRQARPERSPRIREITCVASSEWPPSSKKLSCTPDALQSQHLAPDLRQPLLHRRPRRHVARLRRETAPPPAPAAPCGRPCRWESAAALPGPRRPTAPCTPAAAPADAPAAPLDAHRAVAADHHIGHQPLVARTCPPGPAPPLPAPLGCSASTLSISPSSIRKPRTFT